MMVEDQKSPWKNSQDHSNTVDHTTLLWQTNTHTAKRFVIALSNFRHFDLPCFCFFLIQILLGTSPSFSVSCVQCKSTFTARTHRFTKTHVAGVPLHTTYCHVIQQGKRFVCNFPPIHSDLVRFCCCDDGSKPLKKCKTSVSISKKLMGRLSP